MPRIYIGEFTNHGTKWKNAFYSEKWKVFWFQWAKYRGLNFRSRRKGIYCLHVKYEKDITFELNALGYRSRKVRWKILLINLYQMWPEKRNSTHLILILVH